MFSLQCILDIDGYPTHGVVVRILVNPGYMPDTDSRSPFLAFVSNTRQFDTQLSQYVSSNYVQLK